jgi:hypothetical protein
VGSPGTDSYPRCRTGRRSADAWLRHHITAVAILAAVRGGWRRTLAKGKTIEELNPRAPGCDARRTISRRGGRAGAGLDPGGYLKGSLGSVQRSTGAGPPVGAPGLTRRQAAPEIFLPHHTKGRLDQPTLWRKCISRTDRLVPLINRSRHRTSFRSQREWTRVTMRSTATLDT